MLELAGWIIACVTTGLAAYFYAVGLRSQRETQLPLEQMRLGMDKPARRTGPYPKGSEKKAPRVNDDRAAWQKEQDDNRR
jgi:hypothetical protein